jgi:hypothetical protein
MRIHKMLAVAAGLAVAMLGTGVARADSGGLDPHAKITVPTDPIYGTCQAVSAATGAECFSENDNLNPVEIQGPTLAEIESDPNFDLVTNFFYEPDCVATGVNNCAGTPAAALQTLFFYFSNSINGGIYGCDADQSIANPAFNACVITGGVSIDGVSEVEGELSCNTKVSACTGMLPGQEGSASVTPEPGTLLLLAAGLPLIAFFGLKRRKSLNLDRQNQANLAVC